MKGNLKMEKKVHKEHDPLKKYYLYENTFFEIVKMYKKMLRTLLGHFSDVEQLLCHKVCVKNWFGNLENVKIFKM
jgi:hypothetical protein